MCMYASWKFTAWQSLSFFFSLFVSLTRWLTLRVGSSVTCWKLDLLFQNLVLRKMHTSHVTSDFSLKHFGCRGWVRESGRKQSESGSDVKKHEPQTQSLHPTPKPPKPLPPPPPLHSQCCTHLWWALITFVGFQVWAYRAQHNTPLREMEVNYALKLPFPQPQSHPNFPKK